VFYKIFIFGNTAPPTGKKRKLQQLSWEIPGGYENFNTVPGHH
jgi:hypothetical protein